MRLLAGLQEHGPMLALGVSVVLALGTLAVSVCRTPVERRRLGALTGVGLWLYLLVALVPMPRWSWPEPAAAAPVPVTSRGPGLSPEIVALLGATPPAIGQPVVAPSVPVRQLAVSPPPPAATTPGELLAGAFLLGSGFAGLYLLLGWLRLRWLLRRSRPAPAWLAADRSVRVTEQPTRPFCVGAFRPVVVLPAALVTPARAAAARAVLAHELAHVRAGDCRAQLLFALLSPLLWWQPLYWWLRAQVRFCSELLADDTAARESSVRGYAGELLQLVDADHARIAHAGAVSVFHRPSEFYRRIQMLLGREVPLSRSVPLHRRLASAASGLLLVAFTAGFCGVTPAQEPQSEQELRAEAAQLRQMVKDLKAEVVKLQRQVQGTVPLPALPPGTYPVRDPGAGEPAPAEQVPGGATGSLTLPTEQEWETAVRKREPSAKAFETFNTRLDQHDIAVELDPSKQQPGVPLLKDLPIVGTMFRTDATRAYTVQKGDSLASIASKELGSPMRFEEILKLNPELDPRRLRAGQQILLPALAHDLDAATPGHAPQENAVGQATSPAQPPAPQPAADRSLSDLLNVVTRTIELRGQLEIAQGEFEQQSELAKQGRIDQLSLRNAGIKLRTLRQQVDVADRLLKGELESAQGQLKRLEQLQKAGVLSSGDRELLETRNFVQVLMGAF